MSFQKSSFKVNFFLQFVLFRQICLRAPNILSKHTRAHTKITSAFVMPVTLIHHPQALYNLVEFLASLDPGIKVRCFDFLSAFTDSQWPFSQRENESRERYLGKSSPCRPWKSQRGGSGRSIRKSLLEPPQRQ
ncbi:hypothetical protein CDAR_282551 [Caerostris darwini]|uniref:Uncharacterized protein n=1 Tax=Caerostris darwini TaxID=1538125 RepID=A0AAV4X634_9ARAC|nr:hypothetical protein CDAR_282551 [Caerostris darwini]